MNVVRIRQSVFAVLLALLPTVIGIRTAVAQDDDEDTESEAKIEAQNRKAKLNLRRRQVLEGISKDPQILINVTAKDVPASPDILNLGRKGTAALARCVSDNVDVKIRIRCTELLAQMGDKSALPVLQGALESWEPRLRAAAIHALTKMADPSSFEGLQKLVAREDEEPNIKDEAYIALGRVGDQRAVKLLREVLHSKLKVEAFQGIWASRHLFAHGTLVSEVAFALSKTDYPDLQLQALYAASELRAPELVPAVIQLMDSTDTHKRNRAVYALGRIGDKAAIKALLERVPKVREARMLNNIAFALERLDPKSFLDTTKALAADKQAAIRMNTAFVLGDVRRLEGVPTLLAALSDPNDLVRVSALDALGKIKSKDTIAAIEKLVDGDGSVSEAAIYAIFEISDHTRVDLIRAYLYSSKNKVTKQKALLALARAVNKQAAPDILHYVESGGNYDLLAVEPYLRAAPSPEIPGRLLLAWLKGDGRLGPLLSTLKPAGTAPIAASELSLALSQGMLFRASQVVDVLANTGDSTTPPALLPLLSNESYPLRFHSAVALSRFDVPEAKRADDSIASDFDISPSDWLLGEVRILATIKEPSVQARLTPLLVAREKTADPTMAMAATAVHFEWDPETAIFRFLEALGSNSVVERDLAKKYLVKAKNPLATELIRRALAREQRDIPKTILRDVLDRRPSSGAVASTGDTHAPDPVQPK